MPERSAHEPVGGPVAGTPGDRVPLSNPAIDPEGLAWTRVSPRHITVVVLSTLLSTLFWLAALGWPAVLAAAKHATTTARLRIRSMSYSRYFRIASPAVTGSAP